MRSVRPRPRARMRIRRTPPRGPRIGPPTTPPRIRPTPSRRRRKRSWEIKDEFSHRFTQMDTDKDQTQKKEFEFIRVHLWLTSLELNCDVRLLCQAHSRASGGRQAGGRA